MTAEFELIPAVAGQKNKASTYNTNFNNMKQYIIDSVADSKSYVDNTLTNYVGIITPIATSGTIELAVNTIYRITPTNDVVFSLPEISDNSKYYQILVQLDMTTTLYDIDLDTDWTFNDVAPTITTTGKYNIIYEFDGTNWVCGIIKRSEVA